MGRDITATTLASELRPEELAFLTDLLRRSPLRSRHLEIGTAAGGTLCQMMKCFPDDHRPPFVVVDPMAYFPNQFETVKRNLRQNGLDPDQVDFRVARSADAFQKAAAAQETYDFIFVDGAHKIRYVTQDLHWAQLLNPGGLLLFHDYLPRNPGVTLPVDRFLRRHAHYQREAQVVSLLVLRKTAATTSAEVSMCDHAWAALASLWLQAQASVKKRLPKSRQPPG